MNKPLIEELNRLHKQYKYREIVKIINELPKSELSFEIKGILGRAYINQSKFDKAIEILLSEITNGENDPLWNYRIAIAHYENRDYKEALEHFQICNELGNIEDGRTEYFIKKCTEELAELEERKKSKISITAYNLVVKSVVDDDYSYVTVGITWKGKKDLDIPTKSDKTRVMWFHQSAYGVVGPKVGDFISHYGENSSLQEGIFTHRHIAEELTKKFTGLKFNELIWFENPLEKKLSTGKMRLKRARFLPEKEVDLVHLYSDQYIDVSNPSKVQTDFFNIFRLNGIGKRSYQNTWLMCTEKTAKELTELDFICLYINKATIWGEKN
jgi:tetratricopeptide (TPR) repeat protein